MGLPTPKFYGDRPPVPGARQVPSVPATKAASPPIQTDRWFRNNKPPDASVFSSMNEAMNQAILYRSPEVFSYVGILGAGGGLGVSSVIGTRARWRGAFRTGPYMHALFCRACMYPQSSNFNSNAFARLQIYTDATETAEVVAARTDFYYGVNPLGTANVAGWPYMKFIDRFVEGLSASTDYYLRISDVDYGLIQSIAIADIPSMTENYAGYLPQNFTQESLILDEYRQNLVAPMPTLWKRGGAKVFNWTVDNNQTTPRTVAVATATNLFDGSSTTYGASIPGLTLNMTGKARLSQPLGVPVRVHAYMACTSAANGVVHLRDSAGAILLTLTNTRGAGVGGWITGTVNLPAIEAKYYLTHQTAAGTLSTYAASAYEYD